MSSPATPAPASPDKAPPRGVVPPNDTAPGRLPLTSQQRWALGLASVGSFMVILDMLVVATALTAIQRDLHASMTDLEWTVNAYTLSFAVLLMTAAALGARYGRRRFLAAGFALFSLASVACALAPNTGVLIAARTVQGVGAAAIMPLALGLLNSAFPPARRGWAIGIYGSLGSTAVVLGPVIGGVLTQGLAWEWIFWLNVPIGLLAIPAVLRRTEEGYGNRHAPVDLPGLTVFTLAAVGLVWGLVRSGAAGWGSAEVVGTLAGGAVLAVAFVAIEARTPAPMLPLRLFRSRSFSAGNAVILLLSSSMTGAVFLMTQYQQISLGEGPFATGLRMLPWGVPPVLLAASSGALTDRLGERPLAVAGLVFQSAGMAWLAVACTSGASYLSMVVPMSLAGIGFALGIPAVTKAVVSTSAPADIPMASGAYSTTRQLGGAFGVAILSAAFTAAGSYGSGASFADGFRAALAAAAALAVAGAVAAMFLDR
ncbi:MFS transporter [Actinacidiphila guanduensis]|uniref:Drug resistance transporter, EmrB/QacA subfamily n=1 Tax=Actinacidiphila guanduensis TaxID=310781 RepID=A0A1H0R2J9_9ACTN|nr:MFS transporter [Actinacidiphila guanduensis]SDP23707.1 drug resistance transporter, EmrB/QacA subfamily [Actinacidiphila guanduensis]